jgi:hypothetical protein
MMGDSVWRYEKGKESKEKGEGPQSSSLSLSLSLSLSRDICSALTSSLSKYRLLFLY